MAYSQNGTIDKWNSNQYSSGTISRTTTSATGQAQHIQTRTVSSMTVNNGKINVTKTSQTVIQNQKGLQTDRLLVQGYTPGTSKEIDDLFRKTFGSSAMKLETTPPKLSALQIEENPVTKRKGDNVKTRVQQLNMETNKTKEPSSSWNLFKSFSKKSNAAGDATPSKTIPSNSDAKMFTPSNNYISPYTNRKVPITNTSQTAIKPPVTVLKSTSKMQKKLGPSMAFIFNQVKFVGSSNTEREGSDKDVAALLTTFKIYKIEAKVYTDLTAEQIERAMKQIAQKNFTKASSVIIVILSHGGSGDCVFAKDRPIELNVTFLEPLLRVPELRDKPKIFFIQACKGDKQIEKDTISSPPNEVLKCYSTFEGYYSYRDVSAGSYFIQILCDQLRKLGHTHDIRNIMDTVTAEVQKKTRAIGHEQIPSVLSTVTKKYCFGDYIN